MFHGTDNIPQNVVMDANNVMSCIIEINEAYITLIISFCDVNGFLQFHVN